MVALDTNIVVRFMTNDDALLSPKAKKILEAAKPGTLLLDRLIIEEIGYVLHSNYEFTKQYIVKAFRSLIELQAISVPDKDIVDLAIDLFESEKPLSFEDCWLLALQKLGTVDAVATFDQNLLKRVITLKS